MRRLLFLEVSVFSILLMAVLSSGSKADERPLRVISIDGSITEIIYALDMAGHLVGVDTTSRYPADARELPKVGYMRQLSAEGILSLNPSLIIATAEAGPPEVLQQLQHAGLAVHVIDNASSINGVFDKIRAVAKILNVQVRGETLVTKLKVNTDRIASNLLEKTWPEPPKVMFLLAAGNHGVMLAGKNTQADAMITLMGGTNVVTQFKSYKPLTPEGALQTLPDVIIIADTQGNTSVLESFELLKHTPAAKNNRIVKADSMLLLSFGPRIDKAMSTMAPAFYVSR